ncbi:hypothetical protein ACIGJK_06530 [Pseudomonas iridis]|uniref:hypothetical protein n=1 Tax=Pseudomonas iridis TaxID=2710587 RepID=UPI0037C746E2
MSNLDYFTELGIDKTLKPVSIAHKEISQEEYFKLTISPSFPQIPEFNPNQYIYASLSENSISVIARHNTQEMFYQAGFVMDRDIEDGTYELQGGSGSKVQARFITPDNFSPVLLGQNGQITLKQNKADKTIEATFGYDIIYKSEVYKVRNGTLFLRATGPL